MKKSIKSSVVAAALLTLFTVAAKAQDNPGIKSKTNDSGIRLSVGPEAGLPIGSFRDRYNWSIGGSVQADFPIFKNQLYVTANAGYVNYFGKNDNSDLQLIPVKAGLKYFPVAGLYLQGEAGASFLTNKSDVGAGKSAAFVYAPQIGYQFKLSNRNYLDAGIRFESNTKFTDNGKNNNLLGLRIAYAFGL